MRQLIISTRLSVRMQQLDLKQSRHTQISTHFPTLSILWKHVHLLTFFAFFHTSKLSIALENLGYYSTQFQFLLRINDVIRVILWFIRVKISTRSYRPRVYKGLDIRLVYESNCLLTTQERLKKFERYKLGDQGSAKTTV